MRWSGFDDIEADLREAYVASVGEADAELADEVPQDIEQAPIESDDERRTAFSLGVQAASLVHALRKSATRECVECFEELSGRSDGDRSTIR